MPWPLELFRCDASPASAGHQDFHVRTVTKVRAVVQIPKDILQHHVMVPLCKLLFFLNIGLVQTAYPHPFPSKPLEFL